MRLDRFLAMHGFGSRKSAKKIIHDCRVKVNGVVTTKSDLNITGKDNISVDDKNIENLPYITLMLNKPADYMCSMKDEKYPSVMNLIPPEYQKSVRIVGRLDADTTGLLLFTDNGVLNSRLANPKYRVNKTYEVRVNHLLKQELVTIFKAGNIDIGRDEIADSSDLEILDEYNARITVHEGKYHEIKRLFGKFNYDVIKLKRIKMGPIELGDLKEGKYRLLTDDEYQKLLIETRLSKEEEL